MTQVQGRLRFEIPRGYHVYTHHASPTQCPQKHSTTLKLLVNARAIIAIIAILVNVISVALATDNCGRVPLPWLLRAVPVSISFCFFWFIFCRVTLPGTHAWRSALTWDKPVFRFSFGVSLSLCGEVLHPVGYFSGQIFGSVFGFFFS